MHCTAGDSTKMGLKTITGVHWSNLELEGLLEDEDSCVQLEKVKKHLGLHPFHLTDLNAALREILNATLNFYDTELNGLVLAYKNPKLLSPLGDIFYDTCYVHVDIEADFYIFRPEVGRSLKGFVNKKGTNHIGILLHKAFNVSVPKPDDEEVWPGDKVKVGQEVRFTPEEIDYKTRLPYIRGIMHEEEYLNGCQLFNEEIAAAFESEFQEITRWYNQGESSDNKKKISFKTENKRIVFSSDSEVEVNPEDDLEKKPSVKDIKIKSNDAEKIIKSPSKKKRKRKSTLTSESDTELAQQSDKEQKVQIKKKLLLNISNDSEFEIPKNPSKKRRKNLVENGLSPNDTEDEKPEKSPIHELTQKKILDSASETESVVPNSPGKKHKKKSKKNKIDKDDTEDERNHKSTIKVGANESLDNSTDDPILKKSKKRKKKHDECDDTEDERQYKTTINKTLIQKLSPDDANEAESESESPKIQLKKRRKSFVDNDVPVDTEDEKNYKSSLKKLSKHSEPDNSKAEFEVPHKPQKKRKKKLSTNESNDEFKKVVDDDILMDTEDERIYKSSLITLIQNVKQNQEQGSEFKVPRIKKHKKKRLSTSESEVPFDPLLVVKVKAEPESETEDRRAMKRKLKQAMKEDSRENDIDSESKELTNRNGLAAEIRPCNGT